MPCKDDWHNRPAWLINYSDIDHYYTACRVITAGYLVLSDNSGFTYQISGAVLADALDIDSRNKFLRDVAGAKIEMRSGSSRDVSSNPLFPRFFPSFSIMQGKQVF